MTRLLVWRERERRGQGSVPDLSQKTDLPLTARSLSSALPFFRSYAPLRGKEPESGLRRKVDLAKSSFFVLQGEGR